LHKLFLEHSHRIGVDGLGLDVKQVIKVIGGFIQESVFIVVVIAAGGELFTNFKYVLGPVMEVVSVLHLFELRGFALEWGHFGLQTSHFGVFLIYRSKSSMLSLIQSRLRTLAGASSLHEAIQLLLVVNMDLLADLKRTILQKSWIISMCVHRCALVHE